MKGFFIAAAITLGTESVSAVAPQPDLCAPNSPLGSHETKAFCLIANELGEPILISAAKDQTIYRLMALPSLKPAFIVRLRGKTGRGGAIEVRAWKRGGRKVHLTALLAADEFGEVQRSVRDAEFWQLPTIADHSENPGDRQKDSQIGMVAICGDGTGWVMEAIEPQSYHISYSGCMPYQRFDGLAVSFVTLAQRKFPQLHLNWDK